MSSVLTELCPRRVVAAMEANLCELGRALGQSPLAVLHESPGLLAYRTGLAHPLLNAVLRADLRIEEADRRIAEVLAPFQAQGLPLRWVIGPSSQPADLGARLLAHGFVQEDRPGRETEDLGMAVDLWALNETLPRPEGLTIQPVEDAAGCRAWSEAARRGFELSSEVAEGWGGLLLPFRPSLRHWVGWHNGQPAATASLLLGGGVAGIYHLSTVPEARRQGIGTAMVVEALRAARAERFRVGVLAAAAPEASLYRRIGFREQCLFGVYFWLGTGSAVPQPRTQ